MKNRSLYDTNCSKKDMTQILLDKQFNTFVLFLGTVSRNIQAQFIPYLQVLKVEFNMPKVAQFISKFSPQSFLLTHPQQNVKNIVMMAQKFLQWKVLGQLLLKIIDEMHTNLDKKKSKQKPLKFDKIDLTSLSYEIHYRMSKQYGSHNLPIREKKNRESNLYQPSRPIVRLQEITHYEADGEQNGNILYLNFQGDNIRGKRAYAVMDGNTIQWWRCGANIEDLLKKITQEQLKNDKEDKTVEKEEEKNTVNFKFYLDFKFIGHTGKVTALSISSDQYYIISGSTDRTLKLWCVRMKCLLTEYKGHISTIWDVDFCSSGYYFLSGAADGMMMLWKTNLPIAQRVFVHGSEVNKVSFARNPDIVLSGGDNGRIKLWNVKDAECLRQMTFNSPILNFTLSFSGTFLACCQLNGNISFMNLTQGQTINSFPIDFVKQNHGKTDGPVAHNIFIHDLCFSEDERQFVCVSERHILIYSMERLSQKVASDIFLTHSQQKQQKNKSRVEPKEAIYMGRDQNLTYCKFQAKNLLVVAGTTLKL